MLAASPKSHCTFDEVLVLHREENSASSGRLHHHTCSLSSCAVLFFCLPVCNYLKLYCQNFILFFYLPLIALWLGVKPTLQTMENHFKFNPLCHFNCLPSSRWRRSLQLLLCGIISLGKSFKISFDSHYLLFIIHGCLCRTLWAWRVTSSSESPVSIEKCQNNTCSVLRWLDSMLI